MATIKAFKRDLDRQNDKRIRAELKAERKRLREAIRALKKRQRPTLRKVRHACKRSKKRTLELAREVRLKHREAANREIAELKRASGEACSGSVRKTKAYTRKRVAELERDLREAEARERLLFRKQKSRVLRVQRPETEEEVERNLDAELVPVWRAMRAKKRFHSAAPGMSKTEAFLHWVHENPDDVVELQAELAERKAEKDIEQATDVDRRILAMLKRDKVTQADLDALKVDCDQVEALGLSCDDPNDVEQAYTALHEETNDADADPFEVSKAPARRAPLGKELRDELGRRGREQEDRDAVLSALNEFGGMNEPELSAYTQLPEGRIYLAVDRLLELGSVVRNPKNRELVLAAKREVSTPVERLKNETYPQSRERLLGALGVRGWTVKPDLKTPYAEGEGLRIYFKKQATYATREGQPLATARTVLFPGDKGRRGLEVRELVKSAREFVG